ncbi:enoyl-CoA delta isomerase 2 isoform X1 [Patella vulgata]|uniref:enoyl-CoA delta isomerase 2 isoform X1 n=2 Tax=Patella vulgata TaxID=6465 RepID=UPI00217FD02C|nr:enoyl-CoA delta isomerase 2 isoform X1 [Patella vulgata]
MAASMNSRILSLINKSRLLKSVKNIHTSRVLAMPAHDAEFNQAKERLNTLTEAPGNDVKLKIYGLFKQATEGKCTKPKPGMMDLVGKAKWQAWSGLGVISQDEAQKKYIDLVNELVAAESATSSASESTGDSKFKMINVTKENKIYKITLNRPKKKNALNHQMYDEIVQALDEAGKDNSTLAVITGAGDYFCSGNDLENFTSGGDIPGMVKTAREILLRFVGAFISFPKPLIGLINGPAVGISVTTLGLYDLVYCTDKATFHTPFSNLGQSPEGCSSYTFPKLMGTAKASELLLFNKKITAKEALERNLVTEVFPDHSFQKETTTRVEQYAQLPPQSLQISKRLNRRAEIDLLHRVNADECDVLVERWQSDECMNAIMNFFKQKTSKL